MIFKFNQLKKVMKLPIYLYFVLQRYANNIYATKKFPKFDSDELHPKISSVVTLEIVFIEQTSS